MRLPMSRRQLFKNLLKQAAAAAAIVWWGRRRVGRTAGQATDRPLDPLRSPWLRLHLHL